MSSQLHLHPCLFLRQRPTPLFYDPDHFQPQDSVGYLMRKVLSSIRTQADARVATHDLTYAQWLPLYMISRCKDTTVASLARDLETDPASMTRALDRLEAKGLVVRERSTTDRRVVQLALTEEGRAQWRPWFPPCCPKCSMAISPVSATRNGKACWACCAACWSMAKRCANKQVQPLDTPR